MWGGGWVTASRGCGRAPSVLLGARHLLPAESLPLCLEVAVPCPDGAGCGVRARTPGTEPGLVT